AVFLTEALDATGGIDDLLLAGIERVASRADFHLDRRLGARRTRGEVVTAGTIHLHIGVFRVDVGFHREILGVERQADVAGLIARSRALSANSQSKARDNARLPHENTSSMSYANSRIPLSAQQG